MAEMAAKRTQTTTGVRRRAPRGGVSAFADPALSQLPPVGKDHRHDDVPQQQPVFGVIAHYAKVIAVHFLHLAQIVRDYPREHQIGVQAGVQG